jgi:RNA polymerase sigma-70 factor (ECF subfamily)
MGRERAVDEALVHAVYAEHGRALLAYATRLMGDRAAAEDIVQETLIRAWRHPEVMTNGRGSTRGWLLTVARNLVTDRIRARGRPSAGGTGGPGAPPVERDHADRVVASVDRARSHGRASEGPPRRTARAVLPRAEPRRGRHRARHPAGTVKSRSYYALRALRERLTETEGVRA